MRAIVATCKDWGIGKDDQLLVHNRADMWHFVSCTMGGTVVMGRKTLDSFPGGRPLRGRRNIVLSHKDGFERSGVEVAHSLEELLSLVGDQDPSQIWVIGGASVYQQLLPYCSEAVITKHECIRAADSFFPDLDKDPVWQEIACEGQGYTEEGIAYRFIRYAHR
jgi:dihydrofolate reductase